MELAGYRVLLVDDEPSLCQVLQRVLAREYETVVALTSAREALLLVAAGDSFDVILCDYSMPEMSGLEFHAQLPSSLRDRVVFFTTATLGREAENSLATMPNRCILKPFSMGLVSATVKKMLSAHLSTQGTETEAPSSSGVRIAPTFVR